MKNITITEAEATELLILVRMELKHLDTLVTYGPQGEYEKHWQRRIEIMNSLHDKLTSEEARADET